MGQAGGEPVAGPDGWTRTASVDYPKQNQHAGRKASVIDEQIRFLHSRYGMWKA